MSATTESHTVYGRRLKTLWRALPHGPLTERAMDETLITAGGLYDGDWAGASALRCTLTLCRAVLVRRGDAPSELVYERAEQFPELVEARYGSEAYNRILEAQHRAQHERDLAELEAERKRMWEASPQKAEHDRLMRLIDERTDARLRVLLAEMDDEMLDRMRERLRRADTDDDDAA